MEERRLVIVTNMPCSLIPLQHSPTTPTTCPTYLGYSHSLIGVQVPDLAGLVAGGSEDLGAVGMPAAGEDGCAVRLLCLHTGLASLIELPAADLEWVGHGKGCK